jgi:predicted ribosomally synthesized peptide with nif11-like leader
MHSKLIDALQRDEDFRKELLSARSPEERLEIAARHGLDVSAAELDAWGASNENVALSDRDLDEIDGGAIRSRDPCVIKTPAPAGPVAVPYPNI